MQILKGANLISIVSGHSSVSSELMKQYLQYHSSESKIKSEELDDLKALVGQIQRLTRESKVFDDFFVGYSIPQISKEFDLLRFGQQYIINIELKSIADQARIKKQLKQNKYYLGFLHKEIHLFTFASKTNKLYTLNHNEELVEIPLQYLIEKLLNQTVDKIKDLNALFNPSNYLVSPFNSTDQFIDGRYFLTNQQETIREEVLSIFQRAAPSLLSIKGKAGTGKSLLTYDIAKHLMASGKKVLMVHCGILNQGHVKLSTWYKWNIIPAKGTVSADYSQYDVVILDETQRIYPNQLTHIVNAVMALNKKCLISHDGEQVLSNEELGNKTDERIESEICEKTFELTNKIRSNKEIADFVTSLFDKKKLISQKTFPNIEVVYFYQYADALAYLKRRRDENWKGINYTPSKRQSLPYDKHRIIDEADNAHTVIGQEFDNVIAIIDEHFWYDNGKLSIRNYTQVPYYNPRQMLFQIVTRTRLKLCIVIVNNQEVLEHSLSILNGQK